jgi:DNA-binding NtrC family response regulator
MKDTSVRRPHILVVDDEVAMVRSLELLLRPLGEIHKAYSVPEAEDCLAKDQKIDCIVTDVSMPEASGLELVDRVRRKALDIPVVVMTAYSSVPQAVESIQRGAFEYLVKPFENSEMVSVVKRAIAKHGIAYGGTKKLPQGWICNSRSMQEFLMKAERAAESSCVLLLGETGAGKGRAARWMHEMSSRAKKEFVPVDGRAHDEDSALLSRSLSKVGTLFIAEVFSLSSKLQNRLMEILVESKVSVIAASSSAPELQSSQGFRSDLFSALTAVSLRVPSISERSEDFEALTYEALNSLSEKSKVSQLKIDDRAFTKLRTYSYSGNIRELETILERAALEAKAGVITEDNIQFSNSDLKQLMPFQIPIEEGWKRLELLSHSLEKELILRALEKYPDQSNTQIAAILGTTRRVLELRMKDYHIRET